MEMYDLGMRRDCNTVLKLLRKIGSRKVRYVQVSHDKLEPSSQLPGGLQSA